MIRDLLTAVVIVVAWTGMALTMAAFQVVAAVGAVIRRLR